MVLPSEKKVILFQISGKSICVKFQQRIHKVGAPSDACDTHHAKPSGKHLRSQIRTRKEKRRILDSQKSTILVEFFEPVIISQSKIAPGAANHQCFASFCLGAT